LAEALPFSGAGFNRPNGRHRRSDDEKLIPEGGSFVCGIQKSGSSG
jgi:hypothetical protein